MYRQSRVSEDSLRFAVPEHVLPIRNKVLEFVETEVYPLERELFDSTAESSFQAK